MDSFFGFRDGVLVQVPASEVPTRDFQANGDALPRSRDSKMRESVSLLDFIPESEHAAIAARASTYDCSPAMKIAMASASRIHAPAGDYRFSGTINIKRPVLIQGDAGALVTEGAPFPTRFLFPTGVVGVIVHRRDTDADDTGVPCIVPDGSGGDGATLSHLSIYCDRHAPAEYDGKHGVWLKARARLTNVQAMSFNGDGFRIWADAGNQPADNRGNANCWQMDACVAYGNAGHGLYLVGADANAGLCLGLDASLNGGCGILDSSFLGNIFVGCHTAGNGDAPYKTDNINARSLFLGCYAESGQPPTDLCHPAMAIGGCFAIEGHNVGQGAILESGQAGLASHRTFYSTRTHLGKQISTGLSNGEYDGSLMYFQHTDAPLRFRWEWDTRYGLDLAFGYGNSNAHAYKFVGPVSAFKCGRSEAPTGAVVTHRFFIGNPESHEDSGRMHFTMNAAPASGEWARGDVAYNANPEAGGNLGWVCVESGTPGTWKPFGAIDP